MTGVTVYNDSSSTVTVAYVQQGETEPLTDPIEAGGVRSFGSYRTGECSPAPLVALDPAGRIVARRDAPLCPGESWLIGEVPSASP
jgi:hypothetical protein